MKRSALFWALLISLAFHLLLLGSGLLPSFAPLPDTRFEPIRMKLAAMKLDGGNARPRAQTVAAPAPGGVTVREQTPGPRAARKHPVDGSASAPRARAASAPASAAPETASAPEASAPASQAAPDQRLSATHPVRNFPRRVQMKYQVYYGALMAGLAEIDWSRADGRYRLESRISPIIGPTLRYRSTGRIDSSGLRPDNYEAWRNDAPREHARFDWDNKLLEYGDGSPQQTQLQPGAQDIFSLIYQLALKGANKPPVQITTGKKVYQYPLAPVGEADFDTGFGKIRALVFRAMGEDDQTEFWLAPDFSNQPIRIIRTDPRMKLDMRVTDIVIDDKPEWHLPKPEHRKNEK
jgi:hypothetical protein